MEHDCLVNIFSRLGLDDLTVGVPFVCKSWSRASANPHCWRTLDFGSLDLKPSSPFAKRCASLYYPSRFTFSGFLKLAIARSHGAALDLRFSPLFPASLQVLSCASNGCPKLKALGLPRICMEDEGRFFELLGKWRKLEWLEMESKPSMLANLARQIGHHCEKFQGLKIRGSIGKEDVAAIVESLPKLRFLDLSGSRLAKEEVLAVVDGCRDLKRFSLNDCLGFEADEEVKRRASGIEELELEGCRIGDEAAADEDGDLEQMMMYYDDCFLLWMF
ncbi:F-box/LRR-repeat protein [Apostasia shenzhenica]|uniref:F-box/LRR-repeat protein n=1 Tax=Apostasia shenzhenica TaxID=1088818 RepID=A0A2I0BDY7_9ASPA|nr:F-box/LRR-repeat protein [Apostasia shenzhenica]